MSGSTSTRDVRTYELTARCRKWIALRKASPESSAEEGHLSMWFLASARFSDKSDYGRNVRAQSHPGRGVGLKNPMGGEIIEVD